MSGGTIRLQNDRSTVEETFKVTTGQQSQLASVMNLSEELKTLKDTYSAPNTLPSQIDEIDKLSSSEPKGTNVFSLRDTSREEHFVILQKWEGYVIRVEADCFAAHLVDATGNSPDVEAEIFLDELDREEKTRVKENAFFYWNLGYVDRPSGRMRTSVIRFKRRPSLTIGEISDASASADRLASDLGWE